MAWAQVLIWIRAIAVIVIPIALIWTGPLVSAVQVTLTVALALIAATCGAAYVIHKVITTSRDTGSIGSRHYTRRTTKVGLCGDSEESEWRRECP